LGLKPKEFELTKATPSKGNSREVSHYRNRVNDLLLLVDYHIHIPFTQGVTPVNIRVKKGLSPNVVHKRGTIQGASNFHKSDCSPEEHE